MNLSERARAENRIHEMNWVDKAAYLVKYLARPTFSAPPSVLARFQEQTRLRATLPPAANSPSATLGFVGDLMWIRKNWGNFLPASTLGILHSLDGLVGNLETVVSPNFKVKEFWPDLFLFNSDPRLISSFRRKNGESLFAALSFANNHAFDFGEKGARDTLTFLDSQKIPRSGAGEPRARTWAEFTRGGLRFGFYAATFGLNDPSLLKNAALHLNQIPGLAPDRAAVTPDLGEAVRALNEMAEAEVDFKILSLHWGHEFELYPTDRLMQAARKLVSAGADIIAGSHPHIPQPPEILLVNGFEPRINTPARLRAPGRDRKALVFYSLGNFLSAMFTPYCRLATLWPVAFYRGESGPDWQLKSAEFFYNRNARGGRELIRLPDHAPFGSEALKIGRLLHHLRIA